MKYILSIILLLVISSCHKSELSLNNLQSNNERSITNELGMKFVFINPGTFIMGIPKGYRGSVGGDNPRHQVTLTNGYYLQTTEVTQEQWFLVMGTSPSYFKTCGTDCPVESVSWDDVQEFLHLLNLSDNNFTYRLPTEAEWEYAARSGTNGPYFWGECLSTFHANFRQKYLKQETHWSCADGRSFHQPIPVASLEKNAWGLYDMYGNVGEWCQDYFGERPQLHKQVVDPKGPVKGYARVVRGGSWDSGPTECMSGYCVKALQSSRNYVTGFRLVLTKITDN
jgi:formylglycine-generating enzyme required for sulfatase activity